MTERVKEKIGKKFKNKEEWDLIKEIWNCCVCDGN